MDLGRTIRKLVAPKEGKATRPIKLWSKTRGGGRLDGNIN